MGVVGIALAEGGITALGSAPTTEAFTYQGYLLDGGAPANGLYDFQFSLYDAQAGGTLIGTVETVEDVTVTNGIFTIYVQAGPPQGAFNGDPRWLQVDVRPGSSAGAYTSLPRQPITPAPYAWSLHPGATILGSATGYALGGGVLNVHNREVLYQAICASSASGSAVRAETAPGSPLYGLTETGYAVWGVANSAEDARGYGGYFTSARGVGVYGRSDAPRTYQNNYAPGVYGASVNGAGVYGTTLNDVSPFAGVYGESATGSGVLGESGIEAAIVAGVV